MLKVKNDWETLLYFNDKNPLTPKDINYVKVFWGDGTEEVFLADWTHTTVYYNDMGHRYPARQSQLHINLDYHGTRIKYPLYEHLDHLYVEIEG